MPHPQARRIQSPAHAIEPSGAHSADACLALDPPGWTDQRSAAIDAIATVARIDKTRCTSLLGKAGPDTIRQAGWAAVLGRLVHGMALGGKGVRGATRRLKNLDIQRLCRALGGLPGQAAEDADARLLAVTTLLVAASAAKDDQRPLGSDIMTTESEAALCALAFGKTVAEVQAAPRGRMAGMALKWLILEEAPGRRMRALYGRPDVAACITGPAETWRKRVEPEHRMSAEDVRKRTEAHLAGLWLHACWRVAPASRLAGDILDFTEGWGLERAAVIVSGTLMGGLTLAADGAVRAPPSGYMPWAKATTMLEEGVETLAKLYAAVPETATGAAKAGVDYTALAAMGLAPLVAVILRPLAGWPAGDARGGRVAGLARRLETMQHPVIGRYLLAPLAGGVAQWRLAGEAAGRRLRKRA